MSSGLSAILTVGSLRCYILPSKRLLALQKEFGMTHLRKTRAAGALILTLLLAQASFAEQTLLGEPESTVKLASEKLWRGVVNTASGLGELIRQPILCTQEEGAAGLPVGLFNGVFMSVVRTGAGLLEVATFPWILDESKGYGSLLNPEYVWQLAD